MQILGSKANNAQKVMSYLFKRPMIEVTQIMEAAGVSKRTAYNLLADLERLDILKEITGGKRDKLYVFDDYLKLFK